MSTSTPSIQPTNDPHSATRHASGSGSSGGSHESLEVLVLMGGPDAEREVSLKSGAMIASALRRAGRTVHEQVIERPTLEELRAMPGGVIFPALHGPWGEGGPLQELLEVDGRPFVGCRAKPARLAMDKLATKMLARRIGVPTPPARELRTGEPCDLEPPLVIKPIDDGSTVDVFICRSADEVADARRRIHASRPRAMAERLIAGREITVGWVLGRVLPVIEIVPAEGFYDYDAKYLRNDTEYVLDPHRAESWASMRSRRAPLPESVVARASEYAATLLRSLGARHLARVDFMADDAGPWLLEVNTMPGFTDHSLVPKAAAHAGIDFPSLCTMLVDGAVPADRSAARGSSQKERPREGPRPR
ncbi:MAG: D-alanine--D-alanine ligase [Phycisphaeraceae bacterium]|nr:D-alanine--D-alanine ligase [Phycisphaeraceae bacterium]